jgi:hypothetical protein
MTEGGIKNCIASHCTIFTAFRSSAHRNDFMAFVKGPSEHSTHMLACLSTNSLVAFCFLFLPDAFFPFCDYERQIMMFLC